MTKETIKQMCSSNHREVLITGILSLPLRVGERALIFRGSQPSVMTSSVKEILEVSAYGVTFRTCNTVYRLSYATDFSANEVMCA